MTVYAVIKCVLDKYSSAFFKCSVSALLYVSHTLLMVGIQEESCPLRHSHLIPEALLYTLVVPYNLTFF